MLLYDNERFIVRSNKTTPTPGNETLFFETLVPKSDLSRKELGVYATALDQALTDETIKNVAITGSFGTGKSSILRSYFRKPNEPKISE
jgi:DNA replication protein DnaC